MTKPFCYVTSNAQIIKPSVLDKFTIKQDGTPTSKQTPPDLFTNAYSEYGLIEPDYPPTYLTNLSELNTYHSRCLKTKSEDVGGGGWTLQPVGDNPSEEEYNKLLEFFNKQDNDLWVKAHYDMEDLGYAAVELIRYGDQPDGEPVLLSHIPSHTLRIHKDFDKFMQLRGTGKAWFKRVGVEEDIDSQTGSPLLETVDIPELLPTDKKTRANEVIWNTNYNSNNDYYGVPDILPAVGALYGDKSRTDYNIAFFSNYGIPTYAVTISGDFDDELVDPDDEDSLTYLETAIQQHFRNIQQNPHSTLFLSVPSRPGAEGKVDIKFEPLSIETKEASFRLYRSDNRDEVITAHGMDSYRIGVTVTGSLGGNTAIESKKNYKSSIVQPRQESWEQLINQYIIRDGFGITGWEFRFQSIDVEDEQSDLSIMERLFQLGAVTPNQLIRRFGDRYGLEEGEHESMDKHYLASRPLETEPMEPDIQTNLDTIKVLESLKHDLLEMADDTSKADGNADRGIINRIKKVTNQ